MSWLYVSILFLSLYASIKEREFLPLLIGSVCGVIRMIVGYAVPAAAQFFSSTGINGLIVIGIVTVTLEVVMLRDKNKILFYLTYYLSVSLTSFWVRAMACFLNFGRMWIRNSLACHGAEFSSPISWHFLLS